MKKIFLPAFFIAAVLLGGFATVELFAQTTLFKRPIKVHANQNITRLNPKKVPLNMRGFNPSNVITAKNNQPSKLSVQQEKLYKDIEFDENGIPTYILMKDNIVLSKGEFFSHFKDLFKQREEDKWHLLRQETDEYGYTLYRYAQYYNGMEVDGVQFVLHEKEGRIIAANGRFHSGIDLDITPSISEQQALSEALKTIGAKSYQWEGDAYKEFYKKISGREPNLYPKGELLISAINGIYKEGNFRLVWKFDVLTAEPFDNITIYIDAHSSELINKSSNLQHADVPGTAKTLYSGTQNITVHDSAGTYWLQEKATRGPTASQLIETFDAHSIGFLSPNLPSAIKLPNDNDNIWQTDTSIHLIEFIQIDQLDQNAWYVPLFDPKVDLYFKIYDRFNSLVYTSLVYTNKDIPLTIFDSIPLYSGNAPYRMELWDYDAVGGDDLITTFNIPMLSGQLNFQVGQNIGWVSMRWGNPETDVHWGIEKCYDYYYATFNRNSWDNNGQDITNFVHTNYWIKPDMRWGAYFNASCICDTSSALPAFMIYGDGGYDPETNAKWKPAVALDVTAHEFTHGITAKTAKLRYQNESGALNEGFSDIFAAVIEHKYKPNAINNWLIGEEFIINLYGTPYMRDMKSPNSAGCPQPDTKNGDFWFANLSLSQRCTDEVHTNSGVLNKWFQLLVEGGSGTNDIGWNYAVQGLGWDTAATVAYRTLVGLMPTSDYNAAKGASYTVANTVFSSSPNVYCQLKNAWYAVGVEGNPCTQGTTNYCSGTVTMTAPSASFDDGSGTFNYANNSDCWWVIQPEGADSIDIVFTSFKTEPGYDTLFAYFFDPADAQWYVYDLNGTSYTTPFYIRSPSGIFQLNFVSDGFQTDAGFEAYYYIYGGAYCSGANLYTSCTGSINDGSGGFNYANNSTCEYIIEPAGATSVTLNFTSFNTEGGFDSVYVFSLDPNTFNIIAFLGGYSGSLSVMPSVTSNTGAMYVLFESDYAYKFPGWSANYSATCNPWCNGNTVLTDTVGSFSDGSGTSNYYSNSYCTWRIQPPGADSITLNFTAFSTEQWYDGVIVYDGPDTNSPVLIVHTGNTIPSSITSTGGSLFVEFISDYFNNDNGWQANYIAHIPPLCSGTTTLTATSGTFNDGTNSITPYNNLSDCYWLIQPPGAMSIQITNNYFNTENVNDGVVIYDGATTAAPVLASISGNVSPPVYTSTGGSMLIHFTSNQTIRKNGWEFSYTATTGQPCSSLSVNTSSTNAICTSATGSATVTPAGGNPPYSYHWSNNLTTATISSLTSGNYPVTVTDNNNCATVTSVTVSSTNTTLSINTNSTTPNSRCTNPNGSATVSASGGTSPYTYSWNNGQTSASVSNVSGGSYSVTSTDVNGCSGSTTVTVGTSIVTPTVTITVTKETSANANDGTATANPNGGTPPFQYSWSTSGTTQTLSNLDAGTYSVTITDQSGCTATASAVVETEIGVSIAEPSEIYQLSIFPNPNSGSFVVQVETKSEKQIQISVFNVVGQKIYDSQTESITGEYSKPIDLKNAAEGIYFVRIAIDNGIVNRKIIIR